MKVVYYISDDFITIPLIITLKDYGIYNESFKEYQYYKNKGSKYYLVICFF
jgi:hypothetical protein